MFRNRLYYRIKPLLPFSVRMTVRRLLARMKRRTVSASWPSLPSSARPPSGWTGWPDGKRFAVVLTHDVEGPAGLEKCRALMEMERELGFRSSFNFIPEGSYRVSRSLREELVSHGFEIGVHDLYHDGKLFHDYNEFRSHAKRINSYLKDWGAVGFRAGFMLRRLSWFHHLNIEYDASTFDTDPFEPQPDGTGTIFPFWVPAPAGFRRAENGANHAQSDGATPRNGDALSAAVECGTAVMIATAPRVTRPQSNGCHGYVELPYTLPQDSTLYLLFREKSPAIWIRKTDWIASQGGMLLLNVHPDYVRFPGEAKSNRTFPLEYYTELLKHIRDAYAGQYWQALPREVTAFARERREILQQRPVGSISPSDGELPDSGRTIWIDLENTPHIPFFKPIARELENRGHRVVFTARAAYQTCEMALNYGLAFTQIGRHYGKHKLFKFVGLFLRSLQLLPFAIRERPSLALNHGSRTQTLVCNVLGIPTVTIMDYEFAAELFFLRPLWEIVPDIIPESSASCRKSGGIRKYSGIKEDVYVPDFEPDPSIITQLGLKDCSLIVTVRPPATEAHYHNPEAEILFERFMNRVVAVPGAITVLLPRNKRQEEEIRSKWPQWFEGAKVIVPPGVVDGLNLLWHSDLVVSGGGTMNREAAALGVPVYSIFRGKIGAVDKQLEAEGRLVLIEDVSSIEKKILLQPRPRNMSVNSRSRKALNQIVAHVEELAKLNGRPLEQREHELVQP